MNSARYKVRAARKDDSPDAPTQSDNFLCHDSQQKLRISAVSAHLHKLQRPRIIDTAFFNMRGSGHRGRHGVLIDLIPPVGEPGNGGGPRYPDDGWGMRGDQRYQQNYQQFNNDGRQYGNGDGYSRGGLGDRSRYDDDDMDWMRRGRRGHHQPRGLIGLIPRLLEAQTQSRPSPHAGYPGVTSSSHLQPPSAGRPRSHSSPNQPDYYDATRLDGPGSRGQSPQPFSNQASHSSIIRPEGASAPRGRRVPQQQQQHQQQSQGAPPPYTAATPPDVPPPSYEASRRDRRYT